MKIKFVSFVFFLGSVFFVSPIFSASETFTIDLQHSYVLWSINHFDFSHQVGKWYVGSGTLILDRKKPDQSQVSITIPMAKVVTGLAELDKHLKGKLFFDVEQFPVATFESNKVVVKNKKKAQVYGILNLHGVKKLVILNVTFNNEGINPINNKMTVGFSATTTLKRSDYGIMTLLPGLGDDVNINIAVEAFQEKK